MIETTTTRYKIITAGDGIHWVSLQPLLEDIKEQLDKDNIKNNEHVFHSVESVKVFLEALVSEGNYQAYQTEKLLNEEDDVAGHKDIIQ